MNKFLHTGPAFLAITLAACQAPEPQSPNAPPSAQSVEIGRVDVRGSCSATLEMDLRAGLVRLPVSVVLSTSAQKGLTVGGVGVDVAGLVTARCEIGGENGGRCAQGALVQPKPEQ